MMKAYLAHNCPTCAEIRVQVPIMIEAAFDEHSKDGDISIHCKYRPRVHLKMFLTHDRPQPSSPGDKNKRKGVSIIDIRESPSTSPMEPQSKSEHEGPHNLYWRCILSNLQPGTPYVAKISCHGCEDDVAIPFRTIDTSNLGRHRLRLGILSEPRITNDKRATDNLQLRKSSKRLLSKYAAKLVKDHRVDRIILPGGVCETGTEGELRAAANLLKPVRQMKNVQGVHCLMGRDEAKKNPKRFAKLLIPEQTDVESGCHSVTDNQSGVHLVMLATDGYGTFDDGTAQLDWLWNDLEGATESNDIDFILVFVHYPLVLYSLRNDEDRDSGEAWDDDINLQRIAPSVLRLLRSHSKVKAVICGHAIIPSAVVDDGELVHIMSPKLTEWPCGYDIIDIYDHGLIRSVHEIEEMELQEISRGAAAVENKAIEHGGEERHQSFKHMWGMTEMKC